MSAEELSAQTFLMAFVFELCRRAHATARIVHQHANKQFPDDMHTHIEDLVRGLKREVVGQKSAVKDYEPMLQFYKATGKVPTIDDLPTTNPALITILLMHYKKSLELAHLQNVPELVKIAAVVWTQGIFANDYTGHELSEESDDEIMTVDKTYRGRDTCQCDVCKDVQESHKKWQTWTPPSDSKLYQLQGFVNSLEAFIYNEQ